MNPHKYIMHIKLISKILIQYYDINGNGIRNGSPSKVSHNIDWNCNWM